MARLKEILEELKNVISGKTLDAVLPPLLFVLINTYFGLNPAIVISLVIALIVFGFRLIKKQDLSYAIFGLVGIIIAAIFAFIASSATNFFLPDIITNVFILVVSIISLLINKPIAVYLSHLTRGWSLKWFFRKDILPAYREVTYMWTIFFLIRAAAQVILFIQNDLNGLLLVSTILGLPATLLVLTLSYIYGMWRLKNLKGPGIDEFNQNKQPPFKGQTRGF